MDIDLRKIGYYNKQEKYLVSGSVSGSGLGLTSNCRQSRFQFFNHNCQFLIPIRDWEPVWDPYCYPRGSQIRITVFFSFPGGHSYAYTEVPLIPFREDGILLAFVFEHCILLDN